MPNAWTNHIKEWAKENNMSYMCAMSQPACREAYKKPDKAKKVKATKTAKEPKATKEPKTNQKTKEKLYNEGLEKIKQKVRTDFIPAMKELFFYVKKILLSKKPPSQKAFSAEIEKIQKKYNIYDNSQTSDKIQEIFEKYQNKKETPQDIFFRLWRYNFITVEFHTYWEYNTDITKLYMDMKGLNSNDIDLVDETATELDDDRVFEDLAYDEYNEFFTDKWIADNMKK